MYFEHTRMGNSTIRNFFAIYRLHFLFFSSLSTTSESLHIQTILSGKSMLEKSLAETNYNLFYFTQ